MRLKTMHKPGAQGKLSFGSRLGTSGHQMLMEGMTKTGQCCCIYKGC